MNILLFVGGLILLVFGASVLVRGASKLALPFGISPLVIGLTIVAFGTSAPEVAVSVGAVLDGRTDLCVQRSAHHRMWCSLSVCVYRFGRLPCKGAFCGYV